MASSTIIHACDMIRAVRKEHGNDVAFDVFTSLSGSLGREFGSQMLARLMQEVPESNELMVKIKINSVGPYRINVIKAIREFTNMGLKEAKDITDEVESTGYAYLTVSIDKSFDFIGRLQGEGALASRV